MKLLALSDLGWNKESKQISDADIASFSRRKDFSSIKYESFLRYRAIIDETKPDLVLLAGDITGDGGVHGFHKALFMLLKYLESIKTTTFFIGGNHDLPKYFEFITHKSKDLKYVKYIAGKVVSFKGFKILGLDYLDTYNKTHMKGLISQNHSLDLVLCHCHFARRPLLFNFDTKYVLTGHYQEVMGQIDDKIFLSLENDIPENINYLTIERKGLLNNILYYQLNPLTGETNINKGLVTGHHLKTDIRSSRPLNGWFCDIVNLIRKTGRVGLHKINSNERKKLQEFIFINGKNLVSDYLGTTIFSPHGNYGELRKVLTADMKNSLNQKN